MKDKLQQIKYYLLCCANGFSSVHWFKKNGKFWRKEVFLSYSVRMGTWERMKGTASAFVMTEEVPYLGY